MNDREIIVGENCVCSFSEDAGCFTGFINWDDKNICDLYLHCRQDDRQERLLVKLGFDAIYHDRVYWTNEAVQFVCGRFIPYFRKKTGVQNDNLEELLPKYLSPCAIEFGIDGLIVIGFHGIGIGGLVYDLFASGKISQGFTRLQDGCGDIPAV